MLCCMEEFRGGDTNGHDATKTEDPAMLRPINTIHSSSIPIKPWQTLSPLECF